MPKFEKSVNLKVRIWQQKFSSEQNNFKVLKLKFQPQVNLSLDIISLESVLTDKKTRGIFGEVNLYNILKNVFGEKNDTIWNAHTD